MCIYIYEVSPENVQPLFYLFIYFKRFYLFVERGREGEREGEKHQCVIVS